MNCLSLSGCSVWRRRLPQHEQRVSMRFTPPFVRLIQPDQRLHLAHIMSARRYFISIPFPCTRSTRTNINFQSTNQTCKALHAPRMISSMVFSFFFTPTVHHPIKQIDVIIHSTHIPTHNGHSRRVVKIEIIHSNNFRARTTTGTPVGHHTIALNT
jgi:hypothetical protein